MKISKGNPAIFGCNKINDSYIFTFCSKAEMVSLCLFDAVKRRPKYKIKLDETYKTGEVFSCSVNENLTGYYYCYEENGAYVVDPYAKLVTGCESFGVYNAKELHLSPVLLEDYDWEEDRPPKLKLSDSIFYKLSVRGFTKSKTSKVKAKGTFAGIIEKIPYLKELGVTTLELMPAYEYDETGCFSQFRENTILSGYGSNSPHIYDKKYVSAQDPEQSNKVNFWGYTKGFFMAPKASFTSIAGKSGDYTREFKDMVKQLHRNNMELVMEMFFDDEPATYIIDCIRYWKMQYHVDGFHLYCSEDALKAVAKDPLLSDTKIVTVFWNGEKGSCKHIVNYNSDFRNCARKFLKGDENMLEEFLRLSRNNPENSGCINYIANNNGFTLNDLVSYDRKHNEQNGENNRDGESFNYSWNCGEEGPTRKRKVTSLRLKQIKNAMTMVILSAGVPLIYSGDEFANSQSGNNNPYCVDSELSWVNWRTTKDAEEILNWTKELIKLRKAYKIIHMDTQLIMSDRLSCGYPDLSYHGSNAWYAGMETYSRTVGVMYADFYGDEKTGKLIYVAYNMHWEAHDLALPKIGDKKHKKTGWSIIMCSGEKKEEAVLNVDERTVTVAPRSVAVLVGNPVVR